MGRHPPVRLRGAALGIRSLARLVPCAQGRVRDRHGGGMGSRRVARDGVDSRQEQGCPLRHPPAGLPGGLPAGGPGLLGHIPLGGLEGHVHRGSPSGAPGPLHPVGGRGVARMDPEEGRDRQGDTGRLPGPAGDAQDALAPLPLHGGPHDGLQLLQPRDPGPLPERLPREAARTLYDYGLQDRDRLQRGRHHRGNALRSLLPADREAPCHRAGGPLGPPDHPVLDRPDLRGRPGPRRLPDPVCGAGRLGCRARPPERALAAFRPGHVPRARLPAREPRGLLP